MDAFTFEWSRFLDYLFKIGVAFVLTLPVALDRERSRRNMGLRTFPLVAIGSCGYVLVTAAIIGPDANEAQTRVIQGLMTGIGFVGGGAILKGNDEVHGTSTAASIWATGALGAAVGHGQYEIAVLIGLVTFLTLRLLTSAKHLLVDRDQHVEHHNAEHRF
jgi:putative Mg2+ transporter-C (MgtC) family protein